MDKIGQRTSELASRLRALRLDAGEPSTRELATRTGTAVSHSTIHQALTGKRVPRWGAVELIVEALNGNPEDFRALWKGAWQESRGRTQSDQVTQQIAANEGRYRLMAPALGTQLLSFFHALRLKEQGDLGGATTFLRNEIGDDWSSALVGLYSNCLEKLEDHDALHNVALSVVGREMRTAASSYAAGCAIDDYLQDSSASLDHFLRATRLDPNNAHYYWVAGMTLNEVNRWSEAVAYLKKAVDLAPTDSDFAHTYMQALISLGEFEQAVTWGSGSIHRNHSAIRLLVVRALGLAGRISEALEIIENVPDRARDEAIEYARLLGHTGNPGKAVDVLAEFYQDKYQGLFVQMLSHQILRDAGQLEEANKLLDRAILIRARENSSPKE